MPLAYLRPETLDELLALMRVHGQGARLLAGGTDLLVRLRTDPAFSYGFGDTSKPPLVVIDLKRVPELRADVVAGNQTLRIGARTVMTDVIGDERVREHFPALVEAAQVVGSIQIRNRATLAGNLCNASPAADTAPALLAYGASLNLVSAGASRQMLLDKFFAGPGRTLLAPGEIVASIDLPHPTEPTGSAFGRLTRRRGVDLAIVSVCCVARASGEVRFAFGAVGPRPFVVTTRQDASLDDVVAHASPISDLRAGADYRRAMLAVVLRRTLSTAMQRLQKSRDNR
jgi:CO/xanthine dehydrogenase FAD-binding subunit